MTDAARRPSVDVVIPMRNGATTIFDALASVLAQTEPPHQIFVVDDGSTDGGPTLVRAQELATVTVLESGGRGVSQARNAGIAHSRADFVAFLDCDDLWAPEKLQRQLDVIRDRPDVSVVTCGSMLLDMQHQPIPGTTYAPNLRGRVFAATLRRGSNRSAVSSSILVRRSALLAVGCFDESLEFFEDGDLWLRLAREHVFDCCPAPLTSIVENPASTMRRPCSRSRSREILLQSLSVLEKWVLGQGTSFWVVAYAARLTLTHVIRRRLGLEELSCLRQELHQRVPGLARRMARTEGHLLASLSAACVLYFPSLLGDWQRRRRRLSFQTGPGTGL